MTIEQKCSEAIRPVTEKERERAELAETMLRFAAENLPEISDADRLPGTPADWDNARASLLCHTAVSKYVRALASVAALEQAFHLQKFEAMRPGSFMDEILSELKQCVFLDKSELLKTKLELHIRVAKAAPGLRAVLWDEARKYRGNLTCFTKSLIGYCEFIVREWIEFLPAENFQALLNELQQLKAQPLRAQLKWFGLNEFMEV